MFNPVTMQNEPDTVITNERFAELVRKEERLSVVERMITSNEFVTIKDIAIILGLKKEEGEVTNEQ